MVRLPSASCVILYDPLSRTGDPGAALGRPRASSSCAGSSLRARSSAHGLVGAATLTLAADARGLSRRAFGLCRDISQFRCTCNRLHSTDESFVVHAPQAAAHGQRSFCSMWWRWWILWRLALPTSVECQWLPLALTVAGPCGHHAGGRCVQPPACVCHHATLETERMETTVIEALAAEQEALATPLRTSSA
jgi:hypothetical protein